MLSEKHDEISKYVCVEFRNVARELVAWFEQIVAENGCKIEKKEWKSKYNSYVVYDYEPFCSEGFEISLWVSANSLQYLNFVKFLYEQKLYKIDYLNSCILS